MAGSNTRGQRPSPTKRQLEVLRALDEYSVRNGMAPSVRELAAELGLASTNGANDHLRALERKGLAERRRRNTARSLAVTDLGREWLRRAA
jgi:repressor LexA